MTKLLCVGDLHVKASNLATIDLLKSKILNVVDQTNPDTVVFLGDLSDSHEKIHTLALNAISDLLKEVAVRSRVVALIGNHDILNASLFLDPNAHPFKTLGSGNRITIVDRPLLEGGILYVPYVPVGRFEEAIAGVDLHLVDLVFAHQEFVGCRFNGKESVVGDHWTHPIKVVSGHIHEKQQVGQVYYTGTPYQTNFGESADKSIALVTIDASKDPFCSIQEISLGMPQKITVHLDITEARKFEVPENTDLRLTISGTHDQIAAFKKGSKAQELETQAKVVWNATDVFAPTAAKRVQRGFLDIFWEYGKTENEIVQSYMDEVLK